MHDLLFGTPIWGAGVFMYLLAAPNLGNYTWVKNLAPYTLGIYVSHLLFFIYLSNIAGILNLQFFAKDAFLWTGTVVISILFVWGINKTPLKKVLFR
jgi:surface polysaccharide O-acyltransferase-like enzyme